MSDTKLSIVHLASDEKFINAANRVFEKAFPGSNHFIIPKSRFNRELVYVEKRPNIEIVHTGNGLVKKLVKKTKGADCVIMHGIHELNSTVFLKSSNREKYVGILWGAELFNERFIKDRNLLGPLTQAINLPSYEETLGARIKTGLRKLIYNKKILVDDSVKLAFKSLNYFGLLHRDDLKTFRKSKIVSNDFKMVPFIYYPLEYIMQGNELSRVTGNNILVGNSASATNNHLEALEILSKLDTGNRKIFVPLSYGDPAYADYIQDKGSEIFSDRFNSLRKFMPLPEYNSILRNCGIVIMNHYRSQAFGNILASLWLGCKLYLDDVNPVSDYLRNNGLIIYSVNKDLTGINESALTNLSDEEINHNRSILNKMIGEENVVSRLKEGVLKYFG